MLLGNAVRKNNLFICLNAELYVFFGIVLVWMTADLPFPFLFLHFANVGVIDRLSGSER